MNVESKAFTIADAFNDLLLGSVPQYESVKLNQVEQFIHDRTANMILGNLAIDELPRLSSTTTRILEKLNDKDSEVEEITALVNTDPVIATEILKLANSAHFNYTRKELTNIEQALVILGYENLKVLISTALMKPVMQIKPIYFKMFGKQLWNHSQDCATACNKLAPAYETDPYAAYLLGLIHDIGKVVIFNLLLKAFREIDPNISPRPEIFAEIISKHAPKLSHIVAQSWDFPIVFLDALRENGLKFHASKMSQLGQNLFYGNFFAEIKFLKEKGFISEEEISQHIHEHGMNIELFYDIYPFEVDERD